MLRSIIETSLKSRLVVIAIAAMLIVYGLGRMQHMPVDVLPEFSLPYVEIQTESLGLSAEEVEQLITLGMEQDLLNGVPWLRTIRSESVPGLSSIVLLFEPGTDLMRARQMVSERLTQAVALPHVSKAPAMLQPMSATSRVLIVGLSSKTLSPIQMSVLARWTIAPRLMGVPGVANVAIWGQRDRQLQVQVDPERLKAQNIPLLKVIETAGNALWVSSLSFVEASTPGTGGFIDTDNQRLGIRHILPIVSSAGLSEVPIEGTGRRLGDVASVVEDHQPLIGDALTNKGPGLLMVIEKFPGANTLEVTRGVEAAFAELSPGLPGLDVDSNVYRPADFIEAATRNVGLVLLVGFLLLGLAVAVFFYAWRAAVITLVALPLSLLAAGFVLSATGATMNTIALTGLLIAIGVVVSSAVMDTESIVERLRKHRVEGGGNATARVILESILESRGHLIYAVLIVLLAVLPILFIEGASGAFYRPMAIAYGLAVLASLGVAVTVTPALSMLLLGNGHGNVGASPAVTRLQAAYESILGWTIRRWRLALAGAAVLTLIAALLLPSLNRSLLPWFKERSLLIELNGAPGTSQPEMTRIAGRVSDELRSTPGIHNVGTHIGRAVRGDQIVNVSSATVWVSMDPRADYQKTAAAIQSVVEGYPGIRHSVRSYLRQTSRDIVPEPDDEVIVRVYGDEASVILDQANRVKQAIAGVRGVGEARVKVPVQQATLETEVDLDAARKYGLKPGDVRRAAATLLSGIQVGSLFEEQKVFDVVVWSTPATRRSLSSIGELLIDTPGGGHVRLRDVAKVRIVPTASVIRHEAVKRYIDVVANIEGRDRGGAAAEIQKRIRDLPQALECHASVLGGQENAEMVHARLLPIGIAAALGIFILLQAAFGSWQLAALAFFTLPAGLVGGLLAAAAMGNILTLGSLAGLLGVFGISACNTLVLIRRLQDLERLGGVPLGPALVLRAARERFAPTLLSMLASGLALAPALVMGDIPGLEIIRPMALVVVSGLFTSTIVGLFVLPSLFLSLAVSSVRDRDPFAIPELAGMGPFAAPSQAPAGGGD